MRDPPGRSHQGHTNAMPNTRQRVLTPPVAFPHLNVTVSNPQIQLTLSRWAVVLARLLPISRTVMAKPDKPPWRSLESDSIELGSKLTLRAPSQHSSPLLSLLSLISPHPRPPVPSACPIAHFLQNVRSFYLIAIPAETALNFQVDRLACFQGCQLI